jgi:hypothetical protein
LLLLSVRHHQTDELAEASVAFDPPRVARPTGISLIGISTAVNYVLSKDFTDDEWNTRSFKDLNSDSCVLDRNNKKWVGR